MSEYKIGDHVLIPGRIGELQSIGHGLAAFPSTNVLDAVHPDPGVPIADLVRECELGAWLEANHGGSGDRHMKHQGYLHLVAAREAASKPQYVEGQEVSLRGTVQCNSSGRVVVRTGSFGTFCNVDYAPEDIRPIEPEPFEGQNE